MTELTVQPLDALRADINHHHGEVKRHARGMLQEAYYAGQKLQEAKAQCRHGEFQKWVEANCECSYPQAYHYMQVAKQISTTGKDLENFADMSIREFLGRKEKPKATPGQLTTRQVEKVKKLHALAHSEDNEEEAEVAQRHLESYANSLGLSAEKAVAKATGDANKKASTIPYRNAEERELTEQLVKQAPSKAHLCLAIGRMIHEGELDNDTLADRIEEIINGDS